MLGRFLQTFLALSKHMIIVKKFFSLFYIPSCNINPLLFILIRSVYYIGCIRMIEESYVI